MKRAAVLLAFLTAVLMVSPAGATILTFDELTLENYAPIPGTYGDNVGNTPNITVEYRTVGTSDYFLEFWNNDYGDLIKVAYPSQNGHLAELSLVAAPGYLVKLNSFDLAAYPHTTYSDQTVRILDGNDIILRDWSPAIVNGSTPAHDTYTPGVQAQILRIQYGPNWNVGIDNVNFEQTAVPTPAAFWLLGSGLMGFAAIMRRMRK